MSFNLAISPPEGENRGNEEPSFSELHYNINYEQELRNILKTK